MFLLTDLNSMQFHGFCSATQSQLGFIEDTCNEKMNSTWNEKLSTRLVLILVRSQSEKNQSKQFNSKTLFFQCKMLARDKNSFHKNIQTNQHGKKYVQHSIQFQHMNYANAVFEFCFTGNIFSAFSLCWGRIFLRIRTFVFLAFMLFISFAECFCTIPMCKEQKTTNSLVYQTRVFYWIYVCALQTYDQRLLNHRP